MPSHNRQFGKMAVLFRPKFCLLCKRVARPSSSESCHLAKLLKRCVPYEGQSVQHRKRKGIKNIESNKDKEKDDKTKYINII